jgi:hypothetical protein
MTRVAALIEQNNRLIGELSGYIDLLQKQYDDRTADDNFSAQLIDGITGLSECRYRLQNGNIALVDGSAEVTEALNAATAVNQKIASELQSSKTIKEHAETIAAILSLVKRAIAIAIA